MEPSFYIGETDSDCLDGFFLGEEVCIFLLELRFRFGSPHLEHLEIALFEIVIIEFEEFGEL